jgi:hypothetical protein
MGPEGSWTRTGRWCRHGWFKVRSCQRMIPASRHGQIKSIKQDIEDSKRIGYLWTFIQNLPGQRSKMFQIHVARFLSNRKRSRPSCRRVACHRDSTSIYIYIFHWVTKHEYYEWPSDSTSTNPTSFNASSVAIFGRGQCHHALKPLPLQTTNFTTNVSIHPWCKFAQNGSNFKRDHGHLWPYYPVTCDPIIPGHLRP